MAQVGLTPRATELLRLQKLADDDSDPLHEGPVEQWDFWNAYRDSAQMPRGNSVLDEIGVDPAPADHTFNNVPRGHLTPRPGLPRGGGPAAIDAQKTERQNFLAQTPPGLPGTANLWQGRRVLGAGAEGIIGMWEYTGPTIDTPYQRIAIKQVKIKSSVSPAQFQEEGRIMQRLKNCPTSHVAQLLVDPVLDGPPNPVDPTLGNMFTRLIYEYCPLGSLGDLVDRRTKSVTPFTEVTLWRLFDCLVDGFTVMHVGAEGHYNTQTQQARIPSSPPTWIPIVHFDVKADNIFLGDRDMYHSHTPVCKIGDFGYSELMPPGRVGDLGDESYLRRAGSLGWYAPEQFTAKWDNRDWDTTHVAGLYSSATNIWGIGCLMYHLVALNNSTPQPGTLVNIAMPLNGQPPKGLLYGADLIDLCSGARAEYSQSLIHTVLECLYERPANRIDLKELKEKVMIGWSTAQGTLKAAGRPLGENWNRFIIPPDQQQAGNNNQQAYRPSPAILAAREIIARESRRVAYNHLPTDQRRQQTPPSDASSETSTDQQRRRKRTQDRAFNPGGRRTQPAALARSLPPRAARMAAEAGVKRSETRRTKRKNDIAAARAVIAAEAARLAAAAAAAGGGGGGNPGRKQVGRKTSRKVAGGKQ